MKKILLFLLVPYISFCQTQIGQDIDGEAVGDFSGTGVCISNDGLVLGIGAVNNNGINGSFTGHVRVYRNVNNQWLQIGNDIEGDSPGAGIGFSLDLSVDGSIIAIGSDLSDGVNGESTGSVRVYRNVNDDWVQIGQDIDGERSWDQFGGSVSFSGDGNIIAIGAASNDGVNGEDSGHVRVYRNVNDQWIQIGNDIDGESIFDGFGSTVDISSDGNVISASAINNDGVNGIDSGHVRVFRNVNDQWIQIGNDIDGEASGDNSGTSIVISGDGNSLAIGAPLNFGSGGVAGHVRVFRNVNDQWLQIGNDIDGESPGDTSGRSVSISSNGMILCVSSTVNDGVNGEDSGHVRVYRNVNDQWIQIGNDIDGEATNDRSGFSIDLSSNGSILAIGAPLNDGVEGIDSGHVRVYDLNTILSTEDVLSETNTIIYPNPSATHIQIQVPKLQELKEVKVFNYLGQEVLSSKETWLDISSLSTGNYVVELITNQGKVSKKIVIE